LSSTTAFFFYQSRPPPYLPSFPTRRSSDLGPAEARAADGAGYAPRHLREDPSGRPHDPRAGPSVGADRGAEPAAGRVAQPVPGRSEEHTSELQSRGHLVCRLLLEKKKNNKD